MPSHQQRRHATSLAIALRAQRMTLIAYLQMKVDEADWHGVADAAMDLRELEVALRLTSGESAAHHWV